MGSDPYVSIRIHKRVRDRIREKVKKQYGGSWDRLLAEAYMSIADVLMDKRYEPIKLKVKKSASKRASGR